MEPKQRPFIILPTLMKTQVKCIFFGNQEKNKKKKKKEVKKHGKHGN